MIVALLRLAVINSLRLLGNLLRALFRPKIGWVTIDLRGALPEISEPLPWLRRRLLRGNIPLSVESLRARLWLLGREPRLLGVILRIHSIEAGWATLQGLRDEITAFRAGGKQVVAFLQSPDTGAYYAACAANRVLMPRSGLLMMLGFRREMHYLKDALDRVGICADVFAVSPYKAAAEMLVRNEMSPENREQLQRLIDARMSTLVDTIAAARNKTGEEVRALIDQGPFSAEAAVEAGLVDGLAYEDELPSVLGSGDKPAAISEWGAAARAVKKPYVHLHRRAIGVVHVQGTIVHGHGENVPLPVPVVGGVRAGSENVIKALRKAEKSRAIAAVILRVDSPGGDAFASDLIWREVERVAKKKPIVVSMGDAAASGGYYIAAPASAIVAQPGTLTGSIGVVAMRPNIAGLLGLLRVHPQAVEQGAHAGMFSPSKALTDSEREALHNLIASSYALFRERVRAGRKMSDEALEPLAGGRVWLGEEALKHGLVDAIGGMRVAITKAQQLGKLKAHPLGPMVLIRGHTWERIPPESYPVDKLMREVLDAPRMLAGRMWAISPIVWW